MTTLPKYRGVDTILAQLQSVQSKRWLLRFATGLVAAVTLVLATLLIAAVAAGYWPNQPPSALRWALLLGFIAATAAALTWFVIRTALWRQNPAQTARFVEQSLPDVRNGLINSVLLAQDRDQASPELVQCAILEAAGGIKSVDVRRSISLRPLKRWGIALAVAAVLLGTFATLQPGPFGRGLLAVFAPRGYVPRVNPIELVSIQPGDATAFAGEPVNVVIKIENPQRIRHAAQVIVDGLPTPRPMLAAEANTTYSCLLEGMDQTFRYAVRVGDARWPTDREWYTVKVLQRVEVEGLDVEYSYPPYTELDDRKVANSDGALEAPVGSVATLTLRLSDPVPNALLEVEGASKVLMNRRRGGTEFTTAVPIEQDGAYRIVLRDVNGRRLQQLPEPSAARTARFAARMPMNGQYRIRALPDAAPTVSFVTPNRDVTIPPDDALTMRIAAADKYGLSDVHLTAGLEGGRQLVDEHFPPGDKNTTAEYILKIPATFAADGSTVIIYQAFATDNRRLKDAGPQTSETRKFKILVQDAGKLAAERQEKFEKLRARLAAILEMQEQLRVDAEIAWRKHNALTQVTATGGEITAGQQNVRAELLDLAEKFDFPPEMLSVQRAVAILANNEAQLAVEQAKAVAALTAMQHRSAAIEPLTRTQDQIIDAIQTLLAIIPTMDKTAGERDRSPGDDLPPEAQDRLAKLQEDLDRFIDAQKKVIEASDRLAKKPVDAFTDADQELLKDLQATQDEWEKFLNEQVTDFSKLAQQDFSNPVVLKELMSVKSDVTMAKDALKKEAVEIATALEDNGIENAESLTANLEKWLPDEPDRIKWAMEDPGDGQENVEMPELPTELEDLVGDLLEEEQDIFEEMDDLSSKYTMSGDKGIGWDAMDGPISSMNAQGVTGNQLPNTSEQGGRSGEGRTGKSSGEFVEDKAVGKGGRRTPTRLGEEPYQEGQINDVSTDPPGGATGGGKVSGAGEEGLEGPLPPPLQKELERLAGRQAAIVNKAERLRANFKADDYANFRFLQAITLMNRVKSDLEHYRYENVLRAKHQTLGAIRQTKLLLSGDVNVEADSTRSMPKYVRDNVADAMQGEIPPAYREVLEQYYRRVSEQAAN